ncbi:MAG: oligoribonuclease [Moraxellaceae bacterium]|jgi:oligoribonuclease|nr:MAG: oligoribonuclease [Moraxellaceae bacterium]
MSAQQPSDSHLIWIDLEMTGLNPERDVIIEIATLVTDKDLNILAEGPVFAINQHPSTLAAMDEWNTQQHGGSGLVKRVLESTSNTREAELSTLAFLQQWLVPGKSPMCGNSICQDRRFLAHYMPQLEGFFSYRNLDVSTLKELARRWKPEIAKGLTKKGSHLAMDDIRDSVAELKYYREHFIAL